MTRALILQARLLSAEHLEGENKYHCAFCESKVDATRQIRLHCVPPILCLSLQRFVFDMKVRHASPVHRRHAHAKEYRLAVALCSCPGWVGHTTEQQRIPSSPRLSKHASICGNHQVDVPEPGMLRWARQKYPLLLALIPPTSLLRSSSINVLVL